MGVCSDDMNKCVKCGKNPYIVKVEGFYYVRCYCGKWDKYQFLGLRPENAVDVWNGFNRDIKRIGSKRKKDGSE